MKITWKEGRKSLSAEGTREELASHIAYLDALGIEHKEVEENVSEEDASE